MSLTFQSVNTFYFLVFSITKFWYSPNVSFIELNVAARGEQKEKRRSPRDIYTNGENHSENSHCVNYRSENSHYFGNTFSQRTESLFSETERIRSENLNKYSETSTHLNKFSDDTTNGVMCDSESEYSEWGVTCDHSVNSDLPTYSDAVRCSDAVRYSDAVRCSGAVRCSDQSNDATRGSRDSTYPSFTESINSSQSTLYGSVCDSVCDPVCDSSESEVDIRHYALHHPSINTTINTLVTGLAGGPVAGVMRDIISDLVLLSLGEERGSFIQSVLVSVVERIRSCSELIRESNNEGEVSPRSKISLGPSISSSFRSVSLDYDEESSVSEFVPQSGLVCLPKVGLFDKMVERFRRLSIGKEETNVDNRRVEERFIPKEKKKKKVSQFERQRKKSEENEYVNRTVTTAVAKKRRVTTTVHEGVRARSEGVRARSEGARARSEGHVMIEPLSIIALVSSNVSMRDRKSRNDPTLRNVRNDDLFSTIVSECDSLSDTPSVESGGSTEFFE